MGLKTTNYPIPELGITVPTAYARLATLDIDAKEGRAYATFRINLTREDFDTLQPLKTYSFSRIINKNEPIYTQMYNLAKRDFFQGWEDDIVEEEEIATADYVEE